MTTRAQELYAEVEAFHRGNPKVWELFERFALQKAKGGLSRYSADAVMHRVRWETEAGGGDFKVNNNYVAFYARRFARIHPEHADFFRTRKQPSADRLIA